MRAVLFRHNGVPRVIGALFGYASNRLAQALTKKS
jgi:hypothetical protein